MAKHHSTVSRRNFMKALGLGVAGAAAVGAAAPVFKDLDDLTASEGLKHPKKWWVKEREILKPTNEIQWDVLKPAASMETMWMIPSWKNYVNATEVDTLRKATSATRNTWYGRNKTGDDGYDAEFNGCRMRDWMLQQAGGFQNYSQDLNGYQGAGWGGGKSLRGPYSPTPWYTYPNAYGTGVAAKWQGTNAENTQMLLAAMRYFGAAAIGVVEVNEQTKKLFYDINPGLASMNGNFATTWDNINGDTIGSQFKAAKIVWEKMDTSRYPEDEKTSAGAAQGKGPYAVYDNSNSGTYGKYGKIALPDEKCYILSYVIPMDKELFRTGRGIIRIVGNVSRYSQHALIQSKLQIFLKGLGYWCAGYPNRAFGLLPAQASAILGGECEQARNNNMVNNPNFGSVVGYFSAVTNFPLEPTKPIDAGMWRFCHTCKKCATECPGEAISFDSEPSYEPRNSKYNTGLLGSAGGNLFARAGKESFYTDAVACKMQTETALSCGNCMGTCTFNVEDDAMIHEVVRSVVSTTSLFNGFMWRADDWFGFGITPDEDRERWYEQYRPAFQYNTTL